MSAKSIRTAPKRKPVDWDAVEREYRAGQLSVREIAKAAGISHTAIQKRAKVNGWTQNLAARVREAVATKLVASEVASSSASARQAVEDAATRVVQIVRDHQKSLSRIRAIADTLAERLEKRIAGESVEGVCQGERESAADLLEKLSRVQNRIIVLERQAFSIDAPAPAGGVEPQALNKLGDDDLDKIEAILAKVGSQAG